MTDHWVMASESRLLFGSKYALMLFIRVDTCYFF
jgi:hypothetical protein